MCLFPSCISCSLSRVPLGAEIEAFGQTCGDCPSQAWKFLLSHQGAEQRVSAAMSSSYSIPAREHAGFKLGAPLASTPSCQLPNFQMPRVLWPGGPVVLGGAQTCLLKGFSNLVMGGYGVVSVGSGSSPAWERVTRASTICYCCYFPCSW